MLTSPTSNALNLIANAQYKADTAAHKIATLPVRQDEVGASSEIKSGDLFKPILSLKEAAQENAAGIKLVKAEKEAIGSLFDDKA